MKLFVDSADPTEIGACVAAKATCGVTTSAAALAEAARQAGGGPRELLRGDLRRRERPRRRRGDRRRIATTMLREARDWAAVAANVVVVLPASDAGIEVVRACAAERIRTGVGGVREPRAGAGGRARGRRLRVRAGRAAPAASTATT